MRNYEWPDEPTGKRCDRCGHIQTTRDWNCHCLRPSPGEAASAAEGPREGPRETDKSPPPRLPDSLSEGWRDIETAPRDGTLFLVTGRHDDEYEWYNLAHWIEPIGLMGNWDEGLTPTHWMPLPTPPSGEGGS